MRTHRLIYASSGTRAFQAHPVWMLPIATHPPSQLCPFRHKSLKGSPVWVLPVAFSDLGQRGAEPTAAILNTLYGYIDISLFISATGLLF